MTPHSYEMIRRDPITHPHLDFWPPPRPPHYPQKWPFEFLRTLYHAFRFIKDIQLWAQGRRISCPGVWTPCNKTAAGWRVDRGVPSSKIGAQAPRAKASWPPRLPAVPWAANRDQKEDCIRLDVLNRACLV